MSDVMLHMRWFVPVLLSLNLIGVQAEIVNAVAAFDCDQGVCGFNVVAIQLQVDPCKDQPILVSYSQNSGATLIQCSTDGDSTDNLTYVFDRQSKDSPAFEIEGARFIKAEFLPEAISSGVPDRFGTLPLCKKPTSAKTSLGEMLSIIKVPTSNGLNCYNLLRIATGSGGLSVSGDQSIEPASKATRAKWAPLASQLLPYIPKK